MQKPDDAIINACNMITNYWVIGSSNQVFRLL